MFGNVAFTAPSTYYLGLSSSVPTQISTSNWNFTEPTIGVNGYERLAIASNTTNFGPLAVEPSGGYAVQNLGTITMAQSTGAWSSGTSLIYAGLWDATTGGNLWCYGLLAPVLNVVTSGVQPKFAVGQIVVTGS